MKPRVFYEKRSLKRYRIVFETVDLVIGADRKNSYRTFRKDTGQIAFSRREALEMKLNDLARKHSEEAEKNENTSLSNLDCPALGFNYG